MVIKTGVICSMESHREQPDIRYVAKEMQAIKDNFFGSHTAACPLNM
jgi:hypothetical protein